MARLLKHVSASLRGRTHDEDDTAMRERGATGVFRNLAFQEETDETAVTPYGKAAASLDNNRKSMITTSNETTTSMDVSPRSRDCGQGATMWASPQTSSAASKRASGYSAPAKAPARTSSAVKRGKNSTLVQEITSLDKEAMDELSESEDGDAIAVSNWHGPTATITSSSVRVWEEEIKRLLLAGRHEEAMRWAAPSDGMVRCTMRRIKNFLGNTLVYHLHLESGDTFLMAARKRKKSKASNFVLSTSLGELGRDSEHVVAKLRANFVGTEYSLVSRAAAGQQGGRIAPPSDTFAREDLAVHYKQTALASKGGPRVMLVATPLPEANWAPCASDGSDSLASCLDAARRHELAPRLERQLCMLATRPPEWDPAAKSYTLDFQGRVRASSVKNFQLVHWDHNTDRKGSDLVLQFGKMNKGSEDFALDFTYPLNLQKAFGIALASTDSKLCYAL
ncbi:hypothetical protein Agub_g15074 [Astrephomene gubernaculifera]|uniref:Tubby C-terminal domain-containing protein n=1 Tax=Astrephomene gubernaculifera TaxID=47775 RepID=A0AAD3E2F8_9CHLO|nr:hypothetical protein Agub_g15074 [Astrephomene gubernaculifera]